MRCWQDLHLAIVFHNLLWSFVYELNNFDVGWGVCFVCEITKETNTWLDLWNLRKMQFTDLWFIVCKWYRTRQDKASQEYQAAQHSGKTDLSGGIFTWSLARIFQGTEEHFGRLVPQNPSLRVRACVCVCVLYSMGPSCSSACFHASEEQSDVCWSSDGTWSDSDPCLTWFCCSNEVSCGLLRKLEVHERENSSRTHVARENMLVQQREESASREANISNEEDQSQTTFPLKDDFRNRNQSDFYPTRRELRCKNTSCKHKYIIRKKCFPLKGFPSTSLSVHSV